jgi:hypothetical protein
VKLAIKQSVSMGGRENKSESKTETTGTVIDPSGLTVVSLATTDPSSTVKDAYARAIAARGGDMSQFKFDSELNDVKIVLADGTEIPADVVLRDKDLDLAYLRPSDKQAKPLACLDLTKDAKAQVLDEVIVINRLNQAANRAPASRLAASKAFSTNRARSTCWVNRCGRTRSARRCFRPMANSSASCLLRKRQNPDGPGQWLHVQQSQPVGNDARHPAGVGHHRWRKAGPRSQGSRNGGKTVLR